MKCKTCGNVLEIRVRDDHKIAICHQCKTKRKLKKKTASSTKSSYSNIPEHDVRRKAEKNVKANYAQMLNAGSEEQTRRRKPSPLPKILILLLCLGLFAGAIWYFAPKIKETFFSESTTSQQSTKTADSLSVKTKQFEIIYDRHEVLTNISADPVLCIYYHFTNKQRDTSVSAVSTVELRVMQNGITRPTTTLNSETPEMINATQPVAYNDSILVCQVFSLSDTSDVTAEISSLLLASREILARETLTF